MQNKQDKKKHSIKTVIGNLRNLDNISKVSLVILVGTVTYIVLMFFMKPFFVDPSLPPSHSIVMDNHIMSFDNPGKANLNIFSILGAIIAATSTALILGGNKVDSPAVSSQDKSSGHANHVNAHDEISIIKKVLSPDEKKVIEVIEESGEITQDSLTFRLEWSRAKISTILTHLERLNVIQRKREGKTYIVFIPDKKK